MLKQGSQQKRSTALESILKEYVQTSTVAGLHFAFDRAQPKFGQVLWLALVIALTMAGIYSSVQSYIDWRDDPVVTTISSTGFSILAKKVELNPIEKFKISALLIQGYLAEK